MDGGKGHNHGKPEGTEAAADRRESRGRIDQAGRSIRDAFIGRSAGTEGGKADKRGRSCRGRGAEHRTESIRKSSKSEYIELYRQNYEGFGPTLVQEKLLERDGISISDETLRIWLIAAGLW